LKAPFQQQNPTAGRAQRVSGPGPARARPCSRVLVHPTTVGAAIFAGVLFTQRLFGAGVVVNEIHYDPDVKTEPAEFIELFNASDRTVDLSGWRVTGGVEFLFPAGSQLTAGGFAVVAESPGFLQQRFGITAFGPFAGRLNNDGDRIVLRDAQDAVVDEVDYALGFPWPTVGDPPGYSIELVHPGLDNNLGGSWRVSARGGPVADAQTLVPAGSRWRYFKGLREPSSPAAAWRSAGFDDQTWLTGKSPVGYDPAVAMATSLSDMRGGYASVYLRQRFTVADPALIRSLALEAMFDDGIKVWINGVQVLNQGLPNAEVAFDQLAPGPARESSDFAEFNLPPPRDYLVAGDNILAIQLQNVSLNDSSDCFVDIRLRARASASGSGPTPGAANAVFATNAPPQIRQVAHDPEQPRPGATVRVTAKVTDPDGVGSVTLHYQVVNPGAYIERTDPAYAASWTAVAMRDDALGGDVTAADGVYSAVLPAELQQHRRLVRYRVSGSDVLGQAVTAPYADDPEPNFAYFVYDGVPALTNAVRPGRTNPVTFESQVMSRLPVYHLLAKKATVEQATWLSRYTGDEYRWLGTLVYEGRVYDHIRYRARGGVWRYAMGKNMWKFDFNRGHGFKPRDNYGRRYDVDWTKLNLGACIQQGDYQHRGEHGLFEAVGFRLFNLAGVEAPHTHWIQLRVIDEAAEASPASQYAGDFWGVYLAVEQQDGRFLDQHGLPDGNLYKMEGGTGELNNQGATAATDKSDLNAFLNTYRNTTPSDAWWRANLDLSRYYSYQAIVQGIHHYDICYQKNYFYFLNPTSQLWSVHAWDLDLTWADNMYDADCGGRDEFKDRVLPRAAFRVEYRNRVRELRDLLFNADEAFRLIDEYAGLLRGPLPGPSIVDADRAQWDYNPVMTNDSIVNLSKAGHGLFYKAPEAPTKDFPGMIQSMKNYVVQRGRFLDTLSADTTIPAVPTVVSVHGTNVAVNQLRFAVSAYAGASAFQGVEWRLGEVTPGGAAAAGYPPDEPGRYEIDAVWRSGILARLDPEIVVPAASVRVGRTYRVRARFQDVTGRWSHWSPPAQFVAAESDHAAAMAEFLAVTEIHYQPTAVDDVEFVELFNQSASLPLQLDGALFTKGIQFTFPTGVTLDPQTCLVLAKATNAAALDGFRARYQVPAGIWVLGPFSGSLDNSGESLALRTAAGGTEVFDFRYDDDGGWPVLVFGDGRSLQRVSAELAADDPSSWGGALPSPGRHVEGLPRIASIDVSRGPAFAVHLDLPLPAGRGYAVEYRDAPGAGAWAILTELPAAREPTVARVTDMPPASAGQRFYRLVARDWFP
jgi:hypothetical protein